MCNQTGGITTVDVDPKCENLAAEESLGCEALYNCCDCGIDEDGCGCRYCWSCNACNTCKADESD